jgi:hypothetical protein
MLNMGKLCSVRSTRDPDNNFDPTVTFAKFQTG